MYGSVANRPSGSSDSTRAGISTRNRSFPRANPQQRPARKSLHFTTAKLNFVNNPVRRDSESTATGEHLVSPHDHSHEYSEQDVGPPAISRGRKQSTVKFNRQESASMSELFYDLWFVANLNVFTTVHPITELDTLASFIGYFLLLWITWFLTTVFDARFGQDGILERIARGCHLAVMVGFAIIGVSFDEDLIITPVFRATSLFLMLSRLVLAVQYSIVLFHARYHPPSRNSLMLATALHLLPAIIYLAAAIVSAHHQDKYLFWVWYGAGLIEMGAIILHATFSRPLSFEGTHFNERLNLLTLIILGEGVIILTKNITKIVEYTFVKHTVSDWSPALIGVITSSAATLYITFQLYFDWMHFHRCMKASQQAYWAIIHLPFHIALVLLSEGSSQWDVWWRAMEAFKQAKVQLQGALEKTAIGSTETSKVISALQDKVFDILKKYGADTDKGGSVVKGLDDAFDILGEIPDSFWTKGMTDPGNDYYDDYLKGSVRVLTTAQNAISDAFDISVEVKPGELAPSDWKHLDVVAVERTASRLLLILVYMFVSAGLVLILLMLMHLLSKRRGWSLFNIMRTATGFLVGLGLGMFSLIATNRKLANSFLQTPWQVPTITMAYFFILVLTHLPHPPRVSFTRSKSSKGGLDKDLADIPEGDASDFNLHDEIAQITQHRSRPSMTGEVQVSGRRKASLALRSLAPLRNIHVERGHRDPVGEDRVPLTPFKTEGLFSV